MLSSTTRPWLPSGSLPRGSRRGQAHTYLLHLGESNRVTNSTTLGDCIWS